MDRPRDISGVADQLRAARDGMPAELRGPRAFAATYLRTTRAVDTAVSDGLFEDPAWVEEWDVVFAQMYVEALAAHLAGEGAPRPWRLAFAASSRIPDLGHVLLGVNAHVNYDLPQSLLAVIPPDDFADRSVVERRRRDHERIDTVLAGRVAAEGDELGDPGVVDRRLAPLNRAASRRFLREARRDVWHNAVALDAARREGPEAYARRLAELEVLSAAKIHDLLQPGQVLLRLAVGGFGVRLPPAA